MGTWSFLEAYIMTWLLYNKTAEHFNTNTYFANIKMINEKNEEIYAFFYEPELINENTNCYIILHGIFSNRWQFTGRYLNDKNDKESMYLIPEYREFGESTLSFDAEKVFEDLYNWMQYIICKYNINNFTIIGHSFGATMGLFFYNYLRTKDKLLVAKLDGELMQANINYDKPQTTESFITGEEEYTTNLELLANKEKIVYSNENKAVSKNIHIDSTKALKKVFIKAVLLYAPFSKTELAITELVGKYFSSIKNAEFSKKIDFDISSLPKDINSARNIFLYHSINDIIVNVDHSIAISKELDIKLEICPKSGHITILSFD